MYSWTQEQWIHLQRAELIIGMIFTLQSCWWQQSVSQTEKILKSLMENNQLLMVITLTAPHGDCWRVFVNINLQARLRENCCQYNVLTEPWVKYKLDVTWNRCWRPLDMSFNLLISVALHNADTLFQRPFPEVRKVKQKWRCPASVQRWSLRIMVQ